MASIEVKNLKKSFREVVAVQDISFRLEKPAFVVIAGPSGCGKSTLLNLLAGFLMPDAGDILVDGETILHKKPAERRMSMVFQEAALFPHLTAYENIVYGMHDTRELSAQVQKLAALLHIEALLPRVCTKLSGGEKQRVSIARALIRKPQFFLMDEPLHALDARLRNQLRVELLQLYQRLHTTFFYVTHDQKEAMTMADVLFVWKDGSIQQVGHPQQLYNDPDSLFVASFLGDYDMNCMEGYVSGHTIYYQGRAYKLPIACPAGDVILAFREHHGFISNDGELAGEVVLIERLADACYYHIRCGDTMFVIKDMPDQAAKGAHIRFSFCWEKAFVFDKATERRLRFL